MCCARGFFPSLSESFRAVGTKWGCKTFGALAPDAMSMETTKLPVLPPWGRIWKWLPYVAYGSSREVSCSYSFYCRGFPLKRAPSSKGTLFKGEPPQENERAVKLPVTCPPERTPSDIMSWVISLLPQAPGFLVTPLDATHNPVALVLMVGDRTGQPDWYLITIP